MAISGLSVLMKTLGWPAAPPPPSQATIRLCVHLTGTWCTSIIAESGCGYRELLVFSSGHSCVSPQARTCSSKLVCSKRGPVMALERGCWLRDQGSTRLGAWLITAGLFSSIGVGEVCDLFAVGTAASS